MSEDNENKSNNLEKGDQLVIGPRMKSEAAEKDESEIVRNPESEENHSKTDNSTTSSLMANLSRRRYLNRNDELRTAQLMKAAAENDPYEIKEVMARGAEAVLYRSVCGSFTFCAKATIIGTSCSEPPERLPKNWTMSPTAPRCAISRMNSPSPRC